MVEDGASSYKINYEIFFLEIQNPEEHFWFKIYGDTFGERAKLAVNSEKESN